MAFAENWPWVLKALDFSQNKGEMQAVLIDFFGMQMQDVFLLLLLYSSLCSLQGQIGTWEKDWIRIGWSSSALKNWEWWVRQTWKTGAEEWKMAKNFCNDTRKQPQACCFSILCSKKPKIYLVEYQFKMLRAHLHMANNLSTNTQQRIFLRRRRIFLRQRIFEK